jgi:lipoprotein NlpD
MEGFVRSGATAALIAVLVACSAQKPAPVVDRSSSARAPAAGAPPSPASTTPLTGGREARDGVYTVQRGDTLYSIAHAFGVDFRDLARWNGITDPGLLAVGQALRIAPPAESGAVVVTPIAPSGATEVRPLPGPGAPPVASAPGTPGLPGAQVAKPETKPETKVDPKPVPAESTVSFQWPASGKVIEGFEEPRNKGIDIAGNEGEPVSAAADGEVVYVGSALRGYGNLVIIKHTDDFISAYAHNRQILVKQGQSVKRGQRIAEIGKTDADRPKLHFEIRRQGKPVDPMRYLPPR